MKKMSFIVLMICISQFAIGQTLQKTGPISDQVNELKSTGASFTPVELLKPTLLPSGKAQTLTSLLPNGSYVEVDNANLQYVINAKPGTMHMSLPLSSGDVIELDLFSVEVLAPGFQLVTASTGSKVAYAGASFYRGIDSNDPLSIASLSIFENEVRAIVYRADGNYVLGKIKDQSLNGTHIIYKDANLKGQPTHNCYTPDKPGSYSVDDLKSVGGSSKAGDCIKVYMEAGNDVFAAGGTVSSTANWVTGLFNEMATLYSNESINIALSEIKVWDVKDGYKGNSASWFLSQFQSKSGGYNGDIGMLLKIKNVGGIAASIGGICTGNNTDGMAFSGITGSYSAVPTYSWDVALVTHEFGHIFNSRHTHACVWNGNNTAIDGCAGGTEGSCSNPGLPSGGGTIMSYCDNTSVGINFNLGFGSQPGNVIRNYVISRNCLAASCGTGSTCNNGVQDGNETGVDCGGSCPPCSSCNNGVQDGNETGVDCGGSCPACPTCSDGIQNGNETGVDCGGSCSSCQTTCTAPGGLKASGIKPVRANLTWNTASGANDYTAEIRAVGAGSWASANTGGTSITATGLSSGIQYEWRVTSNCSGASATSSICLFVAGQKNSGDCGAPKFSAEFTVYPNPVNGILYLQAPFSESGEFELTVSDMMGKAMKTEMVQPGEEWQLDFSSFSAGIYLVSMRQTNGELLYKKVIKE